MKPTITIIIPTYNRAEIIKKTLESIISQSFDLWECIVVDDHSTDETKSVIFDFIERDSRIHYMVNERKKGAQGARNTGLYNCKSDWVFFFDSDNTMHQDCLEVLTSGISDDIDVIQCFSRVISVETGITGTLFKWESEGNIHDELFTGETYVDFNHSIIRKSKLIEIGGLDEDCPSMQEWDTHIRLSKTAFYKTIDSVLVDYYVGANDAISTNTKREVKGRMFILKKHLGEWRQRPKAYRKFLYQIDHLIQKEKDVEFKKDAYSRLNEVDSKSGLLISKYKMELLLGRMTGKIKQLLK